MDNFNKKTDNLYFLKGIHFAFSIITFFLAWILFRYGTHARILSRYDFYILAAYAVVLYFFNRTYNSYLFGYARIRSLVLSQIISQFFSVFIVYSFVSIAWFRFYKAPIFVMLIIIQAIIDAVFSYYGNMVYYRRNPVRRSILVYRNERDRQRFNSIQGKPIDRLYAITDELMYDGSFDDLEEDLIGYDAIFVAGVNSRCRNGIVKYCKENDIPGFFLPHVGDVILREAEHIRTFDAPVLYIGRKRQTPDYSFVKRAFDILASFLAIVIFSPLMVITGLMIKLSDHGPVLYKQVRLTKDGKEFEMFKFRSMRTDAERDGVARLSTGDNDDRITPVGRVIRKCRIDELPQLWNILRGDMSIVGPRPERPEIAEQYYETLPDFKLRLQVKAGLTGYAQVYGKYNTDPYEKLEFDLLYISQMSVLTDIQIILSTIPILFKKESTEGIAEGQTLAMK